MRFIHHVLRAAPLDRRFKFYACFKSTVFRLQGQTTPEMGSWRAQFSFLWRMFLVLWSIPFRLRRRKKARVILYNVGKAHALRSYFYKKYCDEELENDEIILLQNDHATEALYFRKLGLRQIVRLFFAAWILFRATFFSAFGRSRINPHWKIRFANMLLQQVLFFDEETDQMLFFAYEPETYLSSLIATGIISDYHPKISSSNSTMHKDNRYFFHPNADLKICSKVLMVEADAYVKKKWMQVNSLELWGLEEAILFDEVKPTAPIYDVGIYSSGGWARTHDLWRCYDLEILKKGGYQDNPLYIKTKFIVDVVCELKAKQEMKVRFYLHPHELALFQNHAIQPPILAQLKENGIDCSFEASNSISEIYESQIGLGVSSTILFDRIHLDLQSLYYNSPDIYDPIVDTRYLGKYADLAFANAEELKTKLELALGRNA